MSEHVGSAGVAAGPVDLGPGTRIDWRNLYWVGLAVAAMIGAILSGDDWSLRYVHVITGVLWTGIDLFMGFVMGPILRRAGRDARRAIITRLVPKTLFIMTALSVIASTSGWFLAVETGYMDLPFPQLWWPIVALMITTVLGLQGLGILLPVNIRIYLQMFKEDADWDRIDDWMRLYVRVVASQGVMQLGVIAIMVRFSTGL